MVPIFINFFVLDFELYLVTAKLDAKNLKFVKQCEFISHYENVWYPINQIDFSSRKPSSNC